MGFSDDVEKRDPSALLRGMHTRLAMMGNKGRFLKTLITELCLRQQSYF